MIHKSIVNPTVSETKAYFSDKAFTGRVIQNEKLEKDTYLEFKDFLDQNLSQKQSFIDFSNTPILYYYCQRSSPGYFCQNLQNTVDDHLQLALIKAYQSADLPIAVFSHYPRKWFDKTDGIPNTLRYYLIAEYIFLNYEPYSVINGKSIWIKKGKTVNWSNIGQDTLIEQPINLKYKHASKHLGQFLKTRELHNFEIHSDLELMENSTAQHLHYTLNETQSSLKHAFLTLKIKTDKPIEKVPIHLWEWRKILRPCNNHADYRYI